MTLVSLFIGITSVSANSTVEAPDLSEIESLFKIPDDAVDLTHSRLIIESYMDPSIDVDGLTQTIDAMAEDIKNVPFYAESTEGKLNGLIQYLYRAGPWNNQTPHQYDFDDPLGTAKPKNKLVSHYLKTRKGNCVSMPILTLMLGERLGLDMSLSTAPLHLFVRLNDNGDIYNIETTAGGLKADSSYIKEFDISFTAMRNGLYLQSLSKKEALATMLTGLGFEYFAKGDLVSAKKIGDLMLEHYPKYVTAMHLQGNIMRAHMKRLIDNVRMGFIQDTPALRSQLDAMLEKNLAWFEQAELLGWQEPPRDYDERYLKMVEEARKAK